MKQLELFFCFSAQIYVIYAEWPSPQVLNLSRFVVPFQKLSTPVTVLINRFCNITAELFSKGLYSRSPENRFVAPEVAEGPGWETLIKPINCPFCCGLQISLTMQNVFFRGRRELSTGLHLQPEGSRQNNMDISHCAWSKWHVEGGGKRGDRPGHPTREITKIKTL